MNKPRFDNLLDQSSDSQKAQVYDWLLTLGYTKTVEKVALPEPDGFGLKTHRASLHRFFVRFSMDLKQNDVSDAAEMTAESPVRAGPPIRRHGSHAPYRLSTGHFTARPRVFYPAQPLDRKTAVSEESPL